MLNGIVVINTRLILCVSRVCSASIYIVAHRDWEMGPYFTRSANAATQNTVNVLRICALYYDIYFVYIKYILYIDKYKAARNFRISNDNIVKTIRDFSSIIYSYLIAGCRLQRTMAPPLHSIFEMYLIYTYHRRPSHYVCAI